MSNPTIEIIDSTEQRIEIDALDDSAVGTLIALADADRDFMIRVRKLHRQRARVGDGHTMRLCAYVLGWAPCSDTMKKYATTIVRSLIDLDQMIERLDPSLATGVDLDVIAELCGVQGRIEPDVK